MQFASIDARGDVRLILDIQQSKMAGAQIEVLIDLVPPARVAVADPLQLQQAMWHLVKNTIASFDRDSRISSVGGDAAGGLAAALAEHGAYVEPELLALVFGSLQRGVEAMQQLYGSLRFGLFIAKGVAEAQRGALTVTNETSSPSAPFRLNFKIAPETAALA